MIGKVLRGAQVGGLIRYLFAEPGVQAAREQVADPEAPAPSLHADPHMVAGFDPPGELEPPRIRRADGTTGRDVRRLVGLLEQPLAAGAGPDRPVWHLALRAAPEDRRLSDGEWAQVAADVMARTGLARPDDPEGVRWVAVRHAEDHIHIAATLARQDGGRARLSNDYYRVGEACRAAEQKYGLRVTAGRDRTAAARPSRGETEKARRAGRAEPARVSLRREVRTAAAAAGSVAEFLDGLRNAGLLVKERMSEVNAGQITGYAVALPGDRTAGGAPIFYGGGKLAADLTMPKLARRWEPATTGPGRQTSTPGRQRPQGGGGRPPTAGQPGARRPRLSETERQRVWADATQAAGRAAEHLRAHGASDPAGAADAAWAAGDALHAAARVVEGRRGGPVTDAAGAYDRAARELWGRTPPARPAGSTLRQAAIALSAVGAARRTETAQLVVLLTQLAALAQAAANLRTAQQRHAQAAAARQAAEQLVGASQARTHTDGAAARQAGQAAAPSARPTGPGTPPRRRHGR